MEDPIHEIEDVIRSITEPYSAQVITQNVEKYFTEDAFILHPLLKQVHTAKGIENLKGIYKMLRVNTINNKLDFHAVMFSQDKLQATIELTERLQYRFLPISRFINIRFISRVDLRKESDGKYRIYRQQDNLPTDIHDSQLPLPVLSVISDVIKYSVGYIAARLGGFFLKNNLFGP
ncbi:hypothetical protein BY996DRAFT_8384789 [Phakopsora pachyrhizi]|nr:hypothetical protein BY996DRAFT_8384789 [Phakopsora pachyrhizi]